MYKIPCNSGIYRTKVEQLVDFLMLAPGWVTTNEIMDYMYGDDPDPPYNTIIAQWLYKARNKGYTIETRNRWVFRIINKPKVVLYYE